MVKKSRLIPFQAFLIEMCWLAFLKNIIVYLQLDSCIKAGSPYFFFNQGLQTRNLYVVKSLSPYTSMIFLDTKQLSKIVEWLLLKIMTNCKVSISKEL